MSALIFSLGCCFYGYSGMATAKAEVMARGWGAEVRIYQRKHEPFMYWFTLVLYFMLTILCSVLVAMLRFRS